MPNKSLAAREEMRKIKEEIDWKEERFRLLSNRVDKNRMADAEMEAELQGLQAGEERRGALWQQFIALGEHGIGTFVQILQREMVPRREEGRRNSEDEQEQGRISQQLVLPGARRDQ